MMKFRSNAAEVTIYANDRYHKDSLRRLITDEFNMTGARITDVNYNTLSVANNVSGCNGSLFTTSQRAKLHSQGYRLRYGDDLG